MTLADHAEPDRCPGLLRPFVAADGALIRLRVPGGQTTIAGLVALSRLSTAYGDGHIAITSRANLQVRGLTLTDGEVDERLAQGVIDAGYLPYPTHERVRNIVASPLTGLLGGFADIRPLVAQVDRLLASEPILADLPGRFLFALDDGRGDMEAFTSDLSYRLVDGTRGILRAGRQGLGEHLALTEAAPVIVERAKRFMQARHSQWRVFDLPDGGAQIVQSRVVASAVRPTPRALGTLKQDDSRIALYVHAPLGLLTADHLGALGQVAGDGSLVITPARDIVVPGIDRDAAGDSLARLSAAGLVADAQSPWSRVFACAGAPGCVRAAFDTRRVAERIVEAGGLAPDEIVHISACDRRCGQPAVPHRVVSSPDGFDAVPTNGS
ncbi:hypothetical protein [Antricoccus suffuscus]|uniref:hypothetical protein n=1 Tax=Antricoccus suffuscus TaxID=1629062 RepID=UPI0011B28106|nr:hypothetical protein [Antricoccus suffuscus]